MMFDLDPLLRAAPAIRFHVGAATIAFFLGLGQLAAAKGTRGHRLLGWIWVIAMAVTATSALFIHELRIWGAWSPIHILVAVTIVGSFQVVHAARRHDRGAHRSAAVSLYVFALVGAGLFTLLPGRILHAVVFGP